MLKPITATATKCRHPRITAASSFNLWSTQDKDSHHVLMLIIEVNIQQDDIQVRGLSVTNVDTLIFLAIKIFEILFVG